ncbi:hypothetical protein CQW23_26911 [Capsicum baccatum]|uniref:NB-ARC domain-containing protein n=1 Tax=Capsicum baccatum TaxID=33114 RepID=A0A2G2VQ70_CAPBA|nr:hypothetical protein CQW23_26911 [Capsicum baccatum]
MPLHLSKLKSLQVLVGAKFLLGGLRMEDLGQLRNLFGSLSVLELENVVDRREAQKAKMRDKNSVEKLSLEWSGSDAENSQTERDILDELRPHTKIKEVEISGYRGTQFPNWLADHSFLNLLVQLSLSNCKDCFSLPALGQLPRLKFLSIRVMHRITEVTEEFYGCPCSKNPFNSLEKLEFAEIPEWKQWHVLGNGEFPALQDLSIKDCPKLMGKLPENLCSLTELRISRCPELNLETPIQLSSLKRFEVDGSPKAGVLFDEAELFTSQLEGMKQIEKLYIRNCNSLTPLPTSTLPSTLKEIRIYCCQKLKLEAPDSSRMISDMFLENFETLDIGSCVEILSVAYGTQMTSLFISDCKNLKRLPEGMQELLPSLKELRLWDCPEIESFPDGGFPFNLQLLEIRDCEKLVNGRKEWRLQRLPHLRELEIYHNGSDKENVGGEDWELPCSIQRLKIGQLKTLSSQLLKSLTSLEYLWTRNLPQIQSLLEEVFPSFLSKLTICSCPNLQSLPESALPSSLSKLIIEGVVQSVCRITKKCTNARKNEISSTISFIAIEILEVSSGKEEVLRGNSLCKLLNSFQEMDIGLAVGGAFLTSALNVLFDRLAPHGELLKMFQKNKHDVGLLERLEDILLGLQIVLSDAENKQASDPLVRKWLNKLQRAVDGAENLLEEVNYEALGLKVEGQHQNLVETSNHQNEIDELIDRLLSKDASEKSPTVVPIVGMGGVGKTTLAKAAYNDEKVKSYFNLKAWFCVSEPYDAIRITKGLLHEIGSFDLKDDNNINQLQVKLKESLKGKRFLIVLDDMWNDDYNEWNNLDPKEHPELEEVGKQIAGKCKGLPSALKTLAGFLSSKSEVDEWTNALRSEIWELPRRPNGILPALMLSYNDLPAHLKQCFAYCAIYPKDYKFCKEQVIHLWIANGLVQPLDSGNQYFNELRSRSLFERVPESFERDGGKFLMHYLVSDLAQISSSKLCVRLEECQGSHMLEQSRHMSYSMGGGGDFEKLKPLSKSKQLRTLLPISIQYLYRPKLRKRVLLNILPRLTSLRALSLSGYEFVELPDALFIKLKLLRFLDLSRTKITKFPDSICA